MFRRRNKLPFWRVLRETLWPSRGWRRVAQYFRYRILRLPGTAFSIAAGLACGVAVSLTPLIGMHFLLAALVAWLIGANIFASAVGTAVGNPWTFPIFWFWDYKIGSWILVAVTGWEPTATLALDQLSYYIIHDPVETIGPVFLPILTGCVVTVPIAWLVTYLVSYRLVDEYQQRRRARLKKSIAVSRTD